MYTFLGSLPIHIWCSGSLNNILLTVADLEPIFVWRVAEPRDGCIGAPMSLLVREGTVRTQREIITGLEW
jgi:hypothetical protein